MNKAEEKEIIVNHLNWTDEQLGKFIRTMANRIRDTEGRDACFATIGLELILGSMAVNNSDGIDIFIEDIIIGDHPSGNYNFTIARMQNEDLHPEEIVALEEADALVASEKANVLNGKVDTKKLLELIHEGINWTKRYPYSSQKFNLFDGTGFQIQLEVTRNPDEYMATAPSVIKDL